MDTLVALVRIETDAEDKSLRSRAEIQDRLRGLIRFLAQGGEIDEVKARAHARALDLVWVLRPGSSFGQQLKIVTALILNQAAAMKMESSVTEEAGES